MYEGDTPNAERRAAALSLDRDLLRELLGQEELRELIDPGALARVEDDLQHRSEMTRATGRDGLHDVLRHVGDLTARGGRRARVRRRRRRRACSRELERERRAIRLRVGGRGALRRRRRGRPLPRRARRHAPRRAARGVPRRRPRRAARARRPLRAHARAVHRRRAARALPRRRQRRPARARARRRRSSAASCGPGGSEREWCDVEVLRRLRRASLAALRKEIEPADQRRLAAFLPSWQGVDRHSGAGAGVDRLREVLVPLQGLALPVEIWERDVLPRRTGAYSQSWIDSLCASGELVWVGAGPLGRSGRVALYFREDAAADRPARRRRLRAGAGASPPSAPSTSSCARASPAARAFFTDLLAELDAPAEALREALWDLVWAGEVTNDAWAPLRAPRLALARAERARRAARERSPGGAPAVRSPAARASAARRRTRRAVAGPGPLVAHRVRLPRRRPTGRPAPPSAGARSPSCCSSATGSSPASRCSPRASGAASPCSTTPSATSRRSASAGAATSSRAWAARSSRCPAPSSGCGLADLRSVPAWRRRRRRAARTARAHARDRRRRPRPALRRRAGVAQARGPAEGRPRRARGRRLRRAGRGRARAVRRARRAQPASRSPSGPLDARRADARGPGGARRRRSAPGGSASSRSSASTASPRSPRASPACSSSWASTPVRAGSRSPPEPRPAHARPGRLPTGRIRNVRAFSSTGPNLFVCRTFEPDGDRRGIVPTGVLLKSRESLRTESKSSRF